MAETTENKNIVDGLRDELGKLSAQIDSMLKTVEAKKSDISSDVVEKLTKELENLRASASARARQAYEAGQAGIDEVGEQVRRNPLASVLIAFGAGCVLSCLIRHLK